MTKKSVYGGDLGRISARNPGSHGDQDDLWHDKKQEARATSLKDNVMKCQHFSASACYGAPMSRIYSWPLLLICPELNSLANQLSKNRQIEL